MMGILNELKSLGIISELPSLEIVVLNRICWRMCSGGVRIY
jgi:hypothetical protein